MYVKYLQDKMTEPTSRLDLIKGVYKVFKQNGFLKSLVFLLIKPNILNDLLIIIL